MNEKYQEKLSGKRVMLADVIPLEVPMSIQIGVTNACNLKCEFCEHSSPQFDLIKKQNLDIRCVKKLVEEFKKKGAKIKQILLTGIGEPLINTQIVDIVKLISDSGVVDRVGIITNGTLLNADLSDRLIDAGLNVLRISLNGLSTEDYQKYTGVAIDFDTMYANLKYFYNRALEARNQPLGKDIQVYIKIMDYMLEGDQNNQNAFKEKFRSVCDILNIEKLNDASPNVDYNKFGTRDYNLSRRGDVNINADICPRVFYEGIISHEGNILACCHDFWYTPNQLIMGNLYEEDFLEVWNGEKYRDLRIKILKCNLTASICNSCTEYKGLMSKEDVIDGKRKELLSFYEE